jgi:hypothetical protein
MISKPTGRRILSVGILNFIDICINNRMQDGHGPDFFGQNFYARWKPR